ncbi:MAG: 3-5 exoribonuclease [Methanobacterium sp.]|jgi:3'-5' exoribonuclease|uniref:3'-5' exoribonuclease YhaM family protein n=1 Tax=Methanobacterium sp. TaxID=2164 RepID=UPI0003C95351|nr:HD domain-containing protein [Methanobacterium sp.]MDI3550657.1 3-5 exoribonuclease [Methanobacterium sp.]CDG65056.1 metal dependent phosphohydrolase [Methanobacterium sp. MB1]
MFKEEQDFIRNLNSVRRINTSFVIASATVKTARNGKDYLEFLLTDKSGQITGRMFTNRNAQEIYESINEKGIYQINGLVDEYPRNSQNFSIKIDDLRALEEDEYQLEDFIRTSNKDQEELLAEIKNTINEMENVYLKELLNSFFNDSEFTQEFCTAPSAKIYHHNYVGGLLEHSVEVLQICRTICNIFPQLDQDLLYTGAILHDVGKLKAYDYDLVSIDISKKGKLLDHLFISAEMVQEKMNTLNNDMPEELQTQLLHLILSHHGAVRNGWGSPVDPQTPEAIALHHADDLDAKVKGSIQK